MRFSPSRKPQPHTLLLANKNLVICDASADLAHRERFPKIHDQTQPPLRSPARQNLLDVVLARVGSNRRRSSSSSSAATILHRPGALSRWFGNRFRFWWRHLDGAGGRRRRAFARLASSD